MQGYNYTVFFRMQIRVLEYITKFCQCNFKVQIRFSCCTLKCLLEHSSNLELNLSFYNMCNGYRLRWPTFGNYEIRDRPTNKQFKNGEPRKKRPPGVGNISSFQLTYWPPKSANHQEFPIHIFKILNLSRPIPPIRHCWSP